MTKNIIISQISIALLVILVVLLYYVPETSFFNVVFEGTIYDMSGEKVKNASVNVIGKQSTRLFYFKEIYFNTVFNKSILKYQDGYKFKKNATINDEDYLYIPNTMQMNHYDKSLPKVTHLFLSINLKKLVICYISNNNKQYIFISDIRKNIISREIIMKFIGL